MLSNKIGDYNVNLDGFILKKKQNCMEETSSDHPLFHITAENVC